MYKAIQTFLGLCIKQSGNKIGLLYVYTSVCLSNQSIKFRLSLPDRLRRLILYNRKVKISGKISKFHDYLKKKKNRSPIFSNSESLKDIIIVEICALINWKFTNQKLSSFNCFEYFPNDFESYYPKNNQFNWYFISILIKTVSKAITQKLHFSFIRMYVFTDIDTYRNIDFHWGHYLLVT